MSSTADRNARLDALEKAINEWADKRTKYLNDTADLCNRMLKGRTGVEPVAANTVTLASELVVDEINTFLTGQLND